MSLGSPRKEGGTNMYCKLNLWRECKFEKESLKSLIFLANPRPYVTIAVYHNTTKSTKLSTTPRPPRIEWKNQFALTPAIVVQEQKPRLLQQWQANKASTCLVQNHISDRGEPANWIAAQLSILSPGSFKEKQCLTQYQSAGNWWAYQELFVRAEKSKFKSTTTSCFTVSITLLKLLTKHFCLKHLVSP